MMKKFLVIIICLISVKAQAQTYNFLTFTETNGNETSVAAAGTVITFAGDNLQVTTTEGNTQVFALTSLSSMRFDETATAIHTLSNNVGLPAIVKIYDTSGRLVRSAVNTATEALTEGLPAGIYIINDGRKTTKQLVR